METLRQEISRLGIDCEIEVDGGVSEANAAKLAKAGADILVAGSSVFKSPDPSNAIKAMKGETQII